MRASTAGKTAKWTGLALLGFFSLLLLTGFCMPSRVIISRATGINAPPSAIYPLVSDFRSGWPVWNAFDDQDPDIRYHYAGPAAGTGAMQSWTSQKIGNGSMTITRADPARGVEFDLFTGAGTIKLRGSLLLESQGSATKLTLTDDMDLGRSPFRRLLGPMIKRMVGESFDKSLASIKQSAESAPTQTR